MVETAGILVFTLWYIAIAYNYYMQHYFRVGMKPRKCRCLMEVPSPTIPCSCSELSTLHGSCNGVTILRGSIKSGGSGRDPVDIIADMAEVVAEVLEEEPPPEDDNAGGDGETPEEDEPVEEVAGDEE